MEITSSGSPRSQSSNATLKHTLRTLELRLLDPLARRNPHLVSGLLANEFREFGKSGRMYDKASILALLAAETPQTITLEDFHVATLGPESALCTYMSSSSTGRARRSSIWQWREGRWQMLFHQGTPIPTSNDPAE